ncbi:MAG: glycosyltransferase family 2 protein [Chitinophagales bacterium]|nr:glycosyltransferase family 2 protein [Chitinophagales bacterium]
MDGSSSSGSSNSTPLVSIITVVYNNKKGLETTLENILLQSYPAIEQVIIDGGSTDGTLAVIEEHKEHISYYVSEKDNGLYDAMNKGIKAAKGDYLWFINSGDEIEAPETLENIYNEFGLEHDIYYGETHLVDEKGAILGTRSQLTTRKMPEVMDWKSMRMGQVVSHQSFIVRRSIAPLYDLQYRCSSDVDWGIRCLKKAETVVNTHQVLTRYLLGGYSKTHQQRCWKERFNIFKKHYGIFSAVFYHIYFVFRAAMFRFKG